MKYVLFVLLLIAVTLPAFSQSGYTLLDKQRFSVLDSAYRGSVASGAAASAVTYNSRDIMADNWYGVRLTTNVIDTVKVKSVPPQVRLDVQGKDYFGNYYTIATIDTFKTEGTRTFLIHPDVTTAAKSAQSYWLPLYWRIQATVYDSGYVNFSIGGELIR